MKFTKPRGTIDWYGENFLRFLSLKKILTKTAKNYGFLPIKTPIFESANLFVRSVGEDSDIVKKEFYEFNDKSNRKLVLRPEGTASIIRCINENKLLEKNQTPIKLFYFSEMFRYERPQSGRLREFNQFGVEIINSNSIYDDVELIILANSILNKIGIKNYEIKLNNIGDFISRNKWIKELKKYFTKYKSQLTEISKSRLNKNPLRILDDKIDGQKDFVKNAPKISNFLSKEENERFEKMCQLLNLNNINYTIDLNLVRGLDYYTNLVFEINCLDPRLSAQPTLIGGGRYGKLVSELGGKDCSCLGFALGIERLLLTCEYENIQLKSQNEIDVFIAPLTESCFDSTINLLNLLRINNISCLTNFNNNKLAKHFSYAKKYNAKYILIIGENELKQNNVILKNQVTLKQETIPNDRIVQYLSNNL